MAPDNKPESRLSGGKFRLENAKNRQNEGDTYIGTKLFTFATSAAPSVAKHDALVCVYFADFAVDEESVLDLTTDQFQPLKRHYVVAKRTLCRRLWTIGVTSQ